MTIGLICNRDAVIIRSDESIHQAAKLMREYHVGSVIVVEDTPLGVKPVGVLTDRDLVVEILALQLQPEAVSIGDVMSFELVTAFEDDGIWVTLKRMRNQGIRRLPVTNQAGMLVGILTMDDILELLVGELNDLVKLTGREREQEILKRNG